ncbi:hypothetical protein CPB86DRAFT_847996 [Serendipita vermifera]|nr:hypothetical protein CPB86DRAFT_847996 [Serendipita vermifera]
MTETGTPKMVSAEGGITDVGSDFSSRTSSPESEDSFTTESWNKVTESTGEFMDKCVKKIIVFPPEIWQHIIACADPSTLANVARVNSVAHGMAMKLLYNSVSLPKMSDSSKLLKTLCSATSRDFLGYVRALDIPINDKNSASINQVLKSLHSLSILKLKVIGQVAWPFKDTRLNLIQFHWEVLQDKIVPTGGLEHGGGSQGLSTWLQTQPNIMKLKLVTHERISVPASSLRNLVRASGPMFIVSSLVPGRPVNTVQVTPRTRDATAGMKSLALSTGPLKHLKIVSRPDMDHRRVLKVLSESNPFLESISFEICGSMQNAQMFLNCALEEFPSFPELQALSFCSRSNGMLLPVGSDYYRFLAEKVQQNSPNLRRMYFPGVIAIVTPKRECNRSSCMDV